MDINELKKSDKVECVWLDPQFQKVVGIKYIQPWNWLDFTMFVNINIDFFQSIDHEFAILHDFSLFPNAVTSVGALHDGWAKSPPLPPNLKSIVILNPHKNAMLKTGFEIIEKVMHRRKLIHFVASMEEANRVLSENGLI